MTRRFVWADQHFGHEAILGFKRDDGTPLRDFASVDDMDWHMIRRYNQVIRNEDTVYFLGDVTMNTKHLERVMPILPGRKILVRGNHDTGKLSQYSKWFTDARACDIKDGVILTHIPIHPDCMSRWRGNIHGHLHHRHLPDARYVCVSVEQTGYAPMLLDKALALLENQAQSDEEQS
jgi:calcineurin-like phosphoesterase family protein